MLVIIEPSDFAFETTGCGTWTLVSSDLIAEDLRRRPGRKRKVLGPHSAGGLVRGPDVPLVGHLVRRIGDMLGGVALTDPRRHVGQRIGRRRTCSIAGSRELPGAGRQTPLDLVAETAQRPRDRRLRSRRRPRRGHWSSAGGCGTCRRWRSTAARPPRRRVSAFGSRSPSSRLRPQRPAAGTKALWVFRCPSRGGSPLLRAHGRCRRPGWRHGRCICIHRSNARTA